MATMRAMSAVPLKQLDATWTPLQQAMEPVPSSPLAPAGAAPPPDMVAVPRNSSWRFSAAGVEASAAALALPCARHQPPALTAAAASAT